MGTLRPRLYWILVSGLPLLALGLLLAGRVPDPALVVPTFHFYVVSVTSIVALGMAALIGLAARRLDDPRVGLLSLAFTGIAAIFLVHALTTPGVLVPELTPWVGFSASLSLLVGAIGMALSASDLRGPRRAWFAARQQRLRWLFIALLVGYGVLAVASSLAHFPRGAAVPGQVHAHAHAAAYQASGDDYGEYATGSAPAGSAEATVASLFDVLASPLVSWSVAAVTLALFGLVILRYSRIYRLSRAPGAAGFLTSAVFLAQGQVCMALAPIWHASWWEYHLLLLAAFGAAVLGLLREYGRSGSLADVVEGLLLGDTIAQLERGYTDVIVALVEAVEAKDPYTRGHTQRVAELSVLIGRELRLSAERLRVLGQAAMLHDIGKIGIPDAVLNKPGRLTPEEFELIKEHPVRGHQIIARVRSLQREVAGVRSHHERLDGSGYPDGLVGHAIPLDARIIAVADVFDALTSPRPYRAAWPRERALAVIDEEAGTKLDPVCVAALHRVLETWTGDLEHAREWAAARDEAAAD